MPTTRVRYVDPDVSGGAADGTSWANAYSSLNAAENAEQLNIVASDEIVQFRCGCTGGTADTAAVSVNGWTTDATRYIEIGAFAADGYRHAGKYATGNIYRLEVSNTDCIAFREDFTRTHGLIAKTPAIDSNADNCFEVNIAGTSGDIRIYDCVCVGANSGSNYQSAVWATNSGTVYVWKVIAHSFGRVNNTGSAVFYCSSSAVMLAYNCVGQGGNYVFNNSATFTAKNCYGIDDVTSGSGDYNGMTALTTCASNDTTGTAGLQSIAYSTSQFVNVTAGSEDLHLAGTGSALYHTGTDTSGDSAPLNFTTDIDGDSYYDTGGVRSIGADEVVSGSSESPSASPSVSPSQSPSVSPSLSPSASPSISPSESPSLSPSASESPSLSPSQSPSLSPSESPSLSPSASESPSLSPSQSPSLSPSLSPSESPSLSPSESPSLSPSASESPSLSPSQSPSLSPSISPSESPSASPSVAGSASESPSLSPSASPSESPSESPSLSPSASESPSASPSLSPSLSPSASPSLSPSASPSLSPSASKSPSASPSASPSLSPSESPSASPSASPSVELQTINPQIALQWSSDGGFTWSSERWRELGKIGEQGKAIYWDRLGRARDRVYRISVIDPVKVTIVDAWIDVTEGTN